MRSISSRHNPVVAMYREAARGEANGRLLLDGAHLLHDALEARLRIEHVLVAADAADSPEIQPLVARLQRDRTAVDAAAATVMAAASPVRSPSAVVALAARPESRTGVFTHAQAFVVVACDVQDPGNLGAMARVAEAAGATGLATAGRGAQPYGWKALRGSMGSLLRLPVETFDSPATALRAARTAGCTTVATVPRGGQVVFGIDLKAPLAIFIGGEGSGLPADIETHAEVRLTIPMEPPVESLNAAVTAALVAYEIKRQRA